VFLTLKLKEVLSESESRELFGCYPQLVDYKLEINTEYMAIEGAERKKLNDQELFEEYYKSKFDGEQVPDEILQIYLKAMSEGDL
jgi:hypothetical protein